jgi:hypothetical protein
MWFALSLAAFALAVVAHALAVRVLQRANRVISFFAVGGLIGGAMILLAALRYGIVSHETAGAAVCYAFLCELYVFLFTLSLSSISANLLARLHLGRMTPAEVEQLYDSHRMVAGRIERLRGTGLLQYEEGRVIVTAKGERLMRTLNAMRVFFGHADASRDSPQP